MQLPPFQHTKPLLSFSSLCFFFGVLNTKLKLLTSRCMEVWCRFLLQMSTKGFRDARCPFCVSGKGLTFVPGKFGRFTVGGGWHAGYWKSGVSGGITGRLDIYLNMNSSFQLLLVALIEISITQTVQHTLNPYTVILIKPREGFVSLLLLCSRA